MNTATRLPIVRASNRAPAARNVSNHAAEICQRQAAWDLFFEKALAGFNHPNLDLCRDWALDRTIRSLGQRPRLPLTAKEREDLQIRREVEALIRDSARIHPNEDLIKADEFLEARLEREETFEQLCDESAAS